MRHPRYQMVHRLEPPADPAGLACLEQRQLQQTACQARCAQAYEACLKTLEPLLQERYAQALQRYEAELDRQAAELRAYALQHWRSWRHGPW